MICAVLFDFFSCAGKELCNKANEKQYKYRAYVFHSRLEIKLSQVEDDAHTRVFNKGLLNEVLIQFEQLMGHPF